MSETRRDLIINLINEYTNEYLRDNTFSFERCNALDIALDLKLDRSNVSRILNQLFNDQILIKVEGRPTLYLSKEIILTEYHFVDMPKVIAGKENLKYLFIHENSDSYFHKKGIDIIGNGYEESLNAVINKITPAILYHQNKSLVIALQGEKGSGKKYFCHKIFDLAIKYKRIPKKSRKYIMDYRSIDESLIPLQHRLLEFNISMLIMEIFTDFEEGDIYRFWNSIKNLCINERKTMPIMIFLVDSSVHNFSYFSQLTPYVSTYPNLKQRTTKELLELTLVFFQEEANNLNCSIKITSNAIASLLNAEYSLNLYQLRNEIVYTLSNNLFSPSITSKESLVITHENISKDVLQRQMVNDDSFEEHIQMSVNKLLPEIIDIHPNQTCDTLENLLHTQPNANIFLTLQLKDIISKVKEDVLMTRTNLLNASSIDPQSKIYQALAPLFAKTKLKSDCNILDKLYTQIQNMVENTFVHSFRLDNLDYKETSYTQELSDNVISTIEKRYCINLLDMYKCYIRNFIYYALKFAKQNTIMTLIVAHGEHIAENYAQHLNQIAGNRCFFSIDYNLYYKEHDFSMFTNTIYKYIKLIDNGKGVLIIGDKPPLTTLNKSIISSLNIPVFSLYPLSLPLLYETNEFVSQREMHLLALLSDIVNKKKKIKRYLSNTSLTIKSERQNCEIFQKFNATFPNINISKSNEALYKALTYICEECNISLTNDIIINFLFHGNALLDRYANKTRIQYTLLEKLLCDHSEVHHIVKVGLLKTHDFMTLSFSNEEIAILCDVILNYKSGHSDE